MSALAPLVLSLVCSVTFSVTDTATTSVQPSYGQLPIHGSVETERQVDGKIYFDFGDTSRMKVPDQLAGVRDDGWRNLSDLEITDQKIIGRYALRLGGAGTFEIDRMDGSVRTRAGNIIVGYRTMRGHCEPYSLPRERLF